MLRETIYYEFGPFRLNSKERLLMRNDQTVAMTPKVFDTLLLLVENSGHVLTKDELMQRLWPDTFVEESSLTQNISLIRRALAESENGNGRSYIETIPKRGYRFVADVTTIPEVDAHFTVHERLRTEVSVEEHEAQNGFDAATRLTLPSDGPSDKSVKLRRYGLIAAGAIVVLAGTVLYLRNRVNSATGFVPRSVAILPFSSLGEGDAQLEGLGVADALINRLSSLDQPVVLPTSSIFRYSNRDKNASVIGRELAVDAVLDGTIQRQGDRVRVTAQLIRVSDGKPIWSQTYDEGFKDAFTLQDSISSQLAPALASRISPESKHAISSAMTSNAEAYQAYLMGMNFWNRRTRENLPKAISYLEQSVQKDPTFARAHAILADCYYVWMDHLPLDSAQNPMRRETSTRANDETEKALKLDDQLAEAYTVKAGLSWCNMNLDAADREFRRALELNPNYSVAHIRYAYFLFAQQRLEDSLSQMKRAVDLDPASPVNNAALGFMLLMSRDYDAAIQAFQKAVELQPDQSIARFNLVTAYAIKGLTKEAFSELEKVSDARPSEILVAKAYVFAQSGSRDQAKQALTQLEKIKNDGGSVRPIEFAMVYALVDKDAAFTWLEKIDVGGLNTSRLKFDPEFDPLRSDPRFTDFLKRHHLS